MSKQEWRKTQETRDVTRWQIDLGGVCLELADYRDSVFCAIIGDLAKDIDAASQEQAQAAALAWARSVLGKALLEAGAEQEILYRCSKCDCLADVPVACSCADGETTQEIYARIECT